MSETKKPPIFEVTTKTNGKLSYSSSVAPINFLVYDFRHQLDEIAEKYPNKVAFIFNMNNGLEMTYSDLRDRSYILAHNLMSLGFKKGERIGFLFPNTYEIVICYYACILAGLISVPLDAFFGAKQIEYMMNNTEASGFIFWNCEEYASLINELLPELQENSFKQSVKLSHLKRVIVADSKGKPDSKIDYPAALMFRDLESKRIDNQAHEFPVLDPDDTFAILSTVRFIR